MKTSHRIAYPCTERGVALVVSMMMLIAITLVGMAAMGNSRLEWLMASNTHFQTSALARAEMTLANTAENQLRILVCAPNCDARTFNWDIKPDAFFNNAFGTDSLLVNPGVVSTWNSLPSNTAVDSTGAVIGRYIVVYRGCVYTVSGAICDQPPTAQFTDTYEVWALSTDVKGTARIVRSTFITTNPAAGTFAWRRIGYSEINS